MKSFRPSVASYTAAMNDQRRLLRHALATLAYRTTRTLERAPKAYATFAGAGRRPVEILAHMGDLFDWALTIAEGHPAWRDSAPLEWPLEQKRFFAALAAFDAYLASDAPLHASVERLFQGPVADALTHTGQLAMLRRLAGSPIHGENYFVATIAAGQVGPDQPATLKTF
jgi:hypothetical protein